MRKADEMNVLAGSVLAEQEEVKKNAAIKYADEILSAFIEEEAKHGYHSATFNKRNDIAWMYLRPYIESNGYKVSQTMHSFTVHW